MKLNSIVIGSVISAFAFMAQAQSEPQGVEPASTVAVAKKSHGKAHAKHLHKVAAKKHHKAKHKAKKSASM
jgi:hypothetical protein